MFIKSKNQEIGIITQHRQNVAVTNTGNELEDFSLLNDKAFIITVKEACKLRVKTISGQIDTFDFMPGDDVGLYDKVYSHADNDITSISIRY